MVFKVIKEKLYNPHTGFYTAYGIEAKAEDTEKRLAFISDVFLCENEAKDFSELLNYYQPELVHLEELCIAAIEDPGNIFCFRE